MLRGADQGAHAVEHVAVGVQPALQVRGHSGSARFELRALAPVAGVGDEDVGHERGQHDDGGQQEARRGRAAAARAREPPSGHRQALSDAGGTR